LGMEGPLTLRRIIFDGACREMLQLIGSREGMGLIPIHISAFR
jgi:hypothetical protein